jgi:hypothetical protein
MRAEAHKFKAVVIWLAVDQNAIRTYMAVAAIVPLSRK